MNMIFSTNFLNLFMILFWSVVFCRKARRCLQALISATPFKKAVDDVKALNNELNCEKLLFDYKLISFS